MSDIKDGSFSLKIMKKNPKPNAPTYELKTVQDIFDILTKKNMNRFFKDFKLGMKTSVHMRELIKAIADSEAAKDGVDMKSIKASDLISMPSFTWIDD